MVPGSAAARWPKQRIPLFIRFGQSFSRASRLSRSSGEETPLELYFLNDPETFFDDNELIGGDIGDCFNLPVGPPNCQICSGFGAEPEVQSAVINRVETGLRRHFLRLLPAPVARSHSRSDCGTVAAHSNQ